MERSEGEIAPEGKVARRKECVGREVKDVKVARNEEEARRGGGRTEGTGEK